MSVRTMIVGVGLCAVLLHGAAAAHAEDPAAGSTDAAPVLIPDPAFAGSLPADQYARATVLDILESGELDLGTNVPQPYQELRVRVLDGPEQGRELDVDNGKQFSISTSQILRKGDELVLVKSFKADGSSFYAVADRYRLPQLAWLGTCFLVLVAVVARWRGIMSFLGLAVSVAVLALYEIPRLAHGSDPLATTLIAATLIVLATIYLAHGFSRQTTIAVASTVLTLLVAVGLASCFVALTHLSGAGSEEAFNLQFGQAAAIDLKGIFLSGILIGVLGVLDDVTTGQVAVVDQLHRANPALGTLELFKRASVVGREHILSLVNTLALAYAGISLPLFLVLANNPQPLWMSLNGEFFAEEIVRTLVGSSSLVLAVPIATALASWLLAHAVPSAPAPRPHRH